MSKILSPKMRQALEILRDHPGIGAASFASAMWPHQGHRPRRMIAMTAGSFIARINKKGWITYGHPEFGTEYYLSEKGQAALREGGELR